jgi:hypothetical protein
VRGNSHAGFGGRPRGKGPAHAGTSPRGRPYVRREVPCRISHSVRRNSEESSWIRRLTRIPKGEGDQSMPVQAWWSCPRVGTVRQGDPCDTANAGLHEAQSPVMQVFIHRKRTCETGAALCVGLFRWLVQPPQRWAMPNEGIEGDEWDA